MRVVVAAYRDKPLVYLGHFGDAEVYKVYEFKEGFKLVEERPNPFRGEHVLGDEEEEGGKRPKVLELVGDADILVAVAFGRGGREFMERHGKRVVLVPPRTSIDEALGRLDTA